LNTTYCITNYENKLCGCLLQDNRIFELQIFSEETSLLGNIYIGKVKNIVKNIDAAFVEIAGGQMCFLPLPEAQNPILTNRVSTGKLVPGDEILVQVKKDAVKTKDPVLTANLSFSGRYCAVQADGNKKIHYSHKMDQDSKKRLAQALKQIVLPDGCSLVVRTQAQELAEPDELCKEAQRLLAQAEQLLQTGRMRTVFSKLSAQEPSYLNLLREWKNWPDKIITDQPSVHTQILQFIREYAPEMESRLTLYQDPSMNLYTLYGLGSKIQEGLERRIWLKSGGYLVIEQTEALVVIDVNTGKFDGKKSALETFHRINMEAAQESARQMRLRNLSGIIIIDFINESAKEAQEELLSYMSELLKEDPVTAKLIDMTPLGLVEITRKKVHMSLAEQLGRK